MLKVDMAAVSAICGEERDACLEILSDQADHPEPVSTQAICHCLRFGAPLVERTIACNYRGLDGTHQVYCCWLLWMRRLRQRTSGKTRRTKMTESLCLGLRRRTMRVDDAVAPGAIAARAVKRRQARRSGRCSSVDDYKMFFG